MSSRAAAKSLSRSVIERVAEAEGVDSHDLETPLYEAIDPDALDALFRATDGPQRSTGRVAFTYCGHFVVISSDGTITLVDEGSAAAEASGLLHN